LRRPKRSNNEAVAPKKEEEEEEELLCGPWPNSPFGPRSKKRPSPF